MAFEPPVTCPICQDTLTPDRTLEDHLVGTHTHREVVRYLLFRRERVGAGTI
ncbi:hypothetical protein [Halopiger djelfimassiliensis]|uniref:hypothetical protein n=1 Tax=Halopiger djelfimassiliensis TaxID=1293047 RepID=UPI000A814B0D|nr:hypothetical protein [Halopiger djelfimassiliensis]